MPKLAYMKNDPSVLLTVSQTEVDDDLIELLTSAVQKFPPSDAWKSVRVGVGGIYCGRTGVAYLFMNVDKTRPNLEIEGKRPIQWAAAYLSGDREPEPITTLSCGIFNEELSFCAVAAAFYKDTAYVQKLLKYLDEIVSSNEGAFEYCYGRAGLLYLLRLVRSWFPESAELVNPGMDSVIENIMANGPPWILDMGGTNDFGTVRYDFVGPGHGRMGIIVQILLSNSTYASKLESALIELLDIQQEDGNWPDQWPGSQASEKNRHLVQWCHGAPGMVQCLVAIREFFPHLQSRIDDSIAEGRRITWEKGLLIKEPNFCHGTTGNAFAFPPGEKRDHFLAHTTEQRVQEGYAAGAIENCDYGITWSVAFGGISRAVGWLWRDKERGCYLGFDDV
ncbi:hypothetical protein NA57DRAFT_71551 [Rhizodiscina lignyota]|uniref:Lanthionine synthetase C-like protein n=1 Tax=Rhizodiscina lignyota TaxID=1504668 RepID=A0A9P4IML8_9PEZI|nr:hypothetical protein NA57DRAFT_71551 [Rhizodiscina lignyota]